MDYECMRCGDIGYVLTYVGGAPPTQEDVPCPDCGPCGVRFEWARRCVRNPGHEGAHTDDVRSGSVAVIEKDDDYYADKSMYGD